MTDELQTDDEVIREIAMTEGPKKVSKFKLRPVDALSLSWMQRNRILDETSSGDMIQRTAAFAYLHTADRTEIRSVVNNPVAFLEAVDVWIEKNIKHHSELEPLSDEMTEAFDAYMAAATSAANPSDPQVPGSKN